MKILLRLSRVSNNLENNIIMVFHYLKVAIRSLLKCCRFCVFCLFHDMDKV